MKFLSLIGREEIFSKIDLQTAYLQISVDKACQYFLVINTHKGLFKYKRLPYGLSSSPAIFQRFISNILVNIPGVAVYMDDIIISGEDESQHDFRLKKVLNILSHHNVQINKSKTMLKAKQIEYLGYLISGNGIRPSAVKVKAIMEAPAPTNVGEVQVFLGMVTYYARTIRNFSTVLAPLYDFLKKDAKFVWSEKEQNAFVTIKNELAHSSLLANFSNDFPIIVETDASPVGVGCVLLQKMNGVEKPVYFASKKLSSAEKNYSQIDKEGLAVVYAVTKFKYFLLGKRFTIRTDHKPLLGLFGRDKQVPQNANARIQRWSLLLSQFDYDLVFKAGKDNKVADALSRLPIEDVQNNSNTPNEYINLVDTLNFKDISFDIIKEMTGKDVVLKEVLHCVKFGWTNKPYLAEYSTVKGDLSVFNHVLLWRNRVVVPPALRSRVLEHLHVGHNGITAMKSEARNWVWWPKIDQDISEITKSCNICYQNFQQPKAPILSWPSSNKIWSRLHIDYAGPIDNKYFLIIIDSHSKFLDVHVCNSITSSVTVNLLRKSFSNFGLPDIIVSDNAPNLVSHEMEAFLEKNGIKHITPAPYHPSSNGLAERAVRTFKQGLAKFHSGDITTRVCRFLYNYRRTVHSTTGKAPAEIMFSRNFRGTIEAVKSSSNKKCFSGEYDRSVSSSYNVGDAMFVKNFGQGKPWIEGQIKEVLGVRNYTVQVHNFGNTLWKRHADQIMPRYIFQENNTPKLPCEYQNNSDNFYSYDFTIPQTPSVPIAKEPIRPIVKGPVVEQSATPITLRRSNRVVKPPEKLNL